jgi:hypothetical protein
MLLDDAERQEEIAQAIKSIRELRPRAETITVEELLSAREEGRGSSLA